MRLADRWRAGHPIRAIAVIPTADPGMRRWNDADAVRAGEYWVCILDDHLHRYVVRVHSAGGHRLVIDTATLTKSTDREGQPIDTDSNLDEPASRHRDRGAASNGVDGVPGPERRHPIRPHR